MHNQYRFAPMTLITQLKICSQLHAERGHSRLMHDEFRVDDRTPRANLPRLFVFDITTPANRITRVINISSGYLESYGGLD